MIEMKFERRDMNGKPDIGRAYVTLPANGFRRHADFELMGNGKGLYTLEQVVNGRARTLNYGGEFEKITSTNPREGVTNYWMTGKELIESLSKWINGTNYFSHHNLIPVESTRDECSDWWIPSHQRRQVKFDGLGIFERTPQPIPSFNTCK